MPHELLLNAAFPRAIVLGLLGGAALVLTVTYSRRGPMIYLPYAALLVAMGLLLSRYSQLPYTARFAAALAALLIATVPLYVAVAILSARGREELCREGRLPPHTEGSSMWARTLRVAFLLLLGVIASAGVAYVAA